MRFTFDDNSYGSHAFASSAAWIPQAADAKETLSETEDQSGGEAKIFLRGAEDVPAVVIKLRNTYRERAVQIIIGAAAQDPRSAGVRRDIPAKVCDANQPMDEQVKSLNVV